MNIVFLNNAVVWCAAILLSVSSAFVNAVEPAIPVSTVLARASEFNQQKLPLSGVLGFTENCGYALYSNHLDAVARFSNKAILVPKLSAQTMGIGRGLVPDDVVGQYVFVEGRFFSKRKKGGASKLTSESLYHIFSSPPYATASCGENSVRRGGVILLEDALYDARKGNYGKRISTVGVIGEHPTVGVALYTDWDAALSKVASNAAVIRFADDIDGASYRKLSESIGKYVVVEGTSAESPLRGALVLVLEGSTVHFW